MAEVDRLTDSLPAGTVSTDPADLTAHAHDLSALALRDEILNKGKLIP